MRKTLYDLEKQRTQEIVNMTVSMLSSPFYQKKLMQFYSENLDELVQTEVMLNMLQQHFLDNPKGIVETSRIYREETWQAKNWREDYCLFDLNIDEMQDLNDLQDDCYDHFDWGDWELLAVPVFNFTDSKFKLMDFTDHETEKDYDDNSFYDSYFIKEEYFPAVKKMIEIFEQNKEELTSYIRAGLSQEV